MSNDQFELGMKNRREVLGAKHVDDSWSRAQQDEFIRPLQELVTEFGWGAIWGRPGLDRKTRSLITLAMLTALNRPHEIKLHLRGALNNGVSKEELRELFLHAGCYCGWPASIDSFRVANELFAELAKTEDGAAKA